MTAGTGTALALLAAIAASPAGAVVTREQIGTFDPGPGLVSTAIDNSSGSTRGDLYEATGFFIPGEIVKLTATGASTGVTITGAETPQESLELVGFGAKGIQLAQIAVDSSGVNSGDLYVADIGHGVVDKFSESGKYICQITGADTPSLSECDILGSKTPAGAMAPSGLAVGTNGDVYVSDAAHDVIDVFGSSGEYLTQYADPKEEPGSLAINAVGDLYVANGPLSEPTGVLELSTEKGGSIVPAPELEAAQAVAVAVDSTTGELIASPSSSAAVTDFDASGTKVGSFGGGNTALAIDEAREEVYTGELLGGNMGIYGPLALAPNEVMTGDSSEVGEEAATLHGQVIPDPGTGGEVSECVFEYGTTSEYEEKVACEQAVPHPGGGEVTAKVGKLSPSSTYHFRLVAKDAGNATYVSGTTYGADETLTTVGPASVAEEAAVVTTTTGTARAQVDSFGFATSCEMQYVDEASFKASGYAGATTVPCSPAELEAGFAAEKVTAPLSGLSIDTTYHYRFVVTNGSKAKTTDGADQTVATFGIESFSMKTVNSEGKPYTQAGGHPYALDIDFDMNLSSLDTSIGENNGKPAADADPKDVITELPPGLVGNANVLPRCTPGQLQAEECSGTTQVGVIEILTEGHESVGGRWALYNIVPPAGTPVELGVNIATNTMVFITANVRTGGDYGVTAVVKSASTNVGLTGANVELWGVPAEASHDQMRRCPPPPKSKGAGEVGPCSAAGVEPKPFLSNPTSCAGEQTAKLRIDSWQAPGQYVEKSASMPASTGCNRLTFAPSISVLPDTNAADSPSGVLVKLHVPQNESNEGLTVPGLRNAVVTLPEGVTLNPSAANGLASCSEAQFGPHNANQPECPNASKVGSIEIETPLLPDRMIGSAYLAEENKNPFGSTFALYVAAQGDGAMVKVAGEVEPNPLTGQLTSSFDENPDVPFSDFRLHFFGGPRAPLATPKVCGTYTTTSILTPWSAPGSGPAPEPTVPFDITTGPGGAPCSTPGFSPSFTAGTTNVQAGGFSQFTLTMGRSDGEQNLGTIKTALPPGLTGELTGVPLCGEPQASQGDCPAASQIGHVITGVGAGPFPLFVPGPGTPQDPVYLTGPYKGAPFGLSVVVPAEAGPFNLDESGLPVVVRAKVSINPITAQVTVESDPLPQILKGVPLDIRDVNVVIDRPGFIINPTNCEPTQLGATLTSALRATEDLTVPFQVTNCAALGFKPEFDVSTSGRTSRTNGASLTAKLDYPSGLGKYANVAKVKVELPKQLPSRLSTLQKACTAATFNANPADCPSASKIGEAHATTPILPVPLNGPAYFVSNGNAKFPELIVVLQGYGVTVDLHGETFISKAGITSSTFATVPDVPVSTFELILPEGPNSALTADGDLCTSKLTMPTEFIAQNGAEIHENTKIAVAGCAKHKQARRRAKHKHTKRRKR